MKQKLGYVGIGLMGKPMVLRLLAAGYEVAVWNRSRDKLAAERYRLLISQGKRDGDPALLVELLAAHP